LAFRGAHLVKSTTTRRLLCYGGASSVLKKAATKGDIREIARFTRATGEITCKIYLKDITAKPNLSVWQEVVASSH
jgi:hypothetical protein